MRFRVETFELYRCTACRTQFLVPDAPTDTEKYSYWDRYKLELYADEAVQADYDKRYEAILEGVERTIGPVRRILDFGSGIGNFVSWALEHGYDAVGVDVDPRGVAAAQERGLPVYLVDEFRSRYEDGWADVACMWDVIEHIDEPLPALRELVQSVRPLGAVVLETPDVSFPVRSVAINVRRVCEPIRWSDVLYYGGHKTYFSEMGLAGMLRDAGAEPVEVVGALSPREKMGRVVEIFAEVGSGAGRLGPIVFDPAMRAFDRLHITNKLIATAVRRP